MRLYLHVLMALLVGLVSTHSQTRTEAADPPGTAVGGVNERPVPIPTVVRVRATSPIVLESDALNPGVFTISRTGDLSSRLNVRYAVGGTARNGGDYKELTGAVTIPAGKDSTTVEIVPLRDELSEGRESVKLSLTQLRFIRPPPVEDDYLVGEPGSAAVVIYDRPEVRPFAPKVDIMEPQSGDVFAEHSLVKVRVQAADADGYITGAALLVDGVRVDSAVLNYLVPPPAGEIAHFSFEWKNVPAGEHTLVAVATDDSGLNSESAPVRVAVRSQPERRVVTIFARDPVASEDDATDTGAFAVVRNGDLSKPLDVHYRISGTAENGVDFEKLSGVVTIPAEKESAPILVQGISDKAIERTETVELKLTQVVFIQAPPLDQQYVIGEPSSARVAIVERIEPPQTPPRVEITKPVSGASFVEHSIIEIEGVASDADGYLTGIELFINERLHDAWITILPPEAPGQKQVRFEFEWKNAVIGEYVLVAKATDNSGLSTRSEPVKVSVRPASEVPVVTIVATDPKASEGDSSNTGEFTIHRTGNVERPLHVFFSVSGTATEGTDYAKLERSVRIPEKERSAKVTIRPISDRVTEGEETVVLKLDGSPLADALINPYRVGEPSSARVAIIEETTPPKKPHVVITAPVSGATFLEHATIKVELEAKDPDGYITHVDLYANERLIASENRVYIVRPPDGELARFSFAWETVPAGEYKLVAKAKDDTGLVGESEPIKITVRGLELQVVTIAAPDPEADEADPENVGVFTVQRRGGARPALDVHYAIRGTAKNSVDYRELTGVVTIREGDESARILVQAKDDDEAEGRETVLLQLVVPPNLSNASDDALVAVGAGYRVGEPDNATVAIIDSGEHGSFVRRDLPETYTPGTALRVTLAATPADPVVVYAVEDRPPRGWAVGQISHGGTFDSATRKVKFGPFFDHEARTFGYEVTPENDTTGPREFAGVASANGHDSRILGDHLITNGRIHHPADRAAEDFFIRISELTAYATAWKTGAEWPGGPNPIPQSYVTRAGEIWRKGEQYTFDPSAGPPPLWWVPKTPGDAARPLADLTLDGRMRVVAGGERVGHAVRILKSEEASGRLQHVTITVTPARGVSAYSIEERIARDWVVSNISGDGQFDAASSTIRWGLFLDAEPRVLTYQIAVPASLVNRSFFQGAVSFDGVEVPVNSTVSGKIATIADQIGAVLERVKARVTDLRRHENGHTEISFQGDIGARYAIQVSTDLVNWIDLGNVLNETGEVQILDVEAAQSSVRYYRAKPME